MTNEIKNRFEEKFDELNTLTEVVMATKNIKDFEDILIDAYIEGFVGAEYILGEDNKVNAESINRAIDKSYDGVSINDKANAYMRENDIVGLKRLVESEFHRVYNTGSMDAAEMSDKTLYKTWVTAGDDKVRDTHYYLEGQKIPVDAYFYTFDGDKALAPGDFMLTENNANCRCILDYSVQ